ncbi:unnamed protein product [Hymenolepis diminuta]|uniref:Uncharacterized protein n=1 Tax=Hymenolepis diminuta TaxID=6216 RepID=A0A564YXM2_HYMDI|nr:unnamed protein product [Hymenolepis diminuta]
MDPPGIFKRVYQSISNKDFVDSLVGFAEFHCFQSVGGQNNPRRYLKDPFPVLMALMLIGDDDDSHDALKFGHRHPLHIAHYLAKLRRYLLPICLSQKYSLPMKMNYGRSSPWM